MTGLLQESARSWLSAPQEGGAEQFVVAVVQWLKLGIETVGAGIVAIGVVVAIYKFIAAIARRETEDYNQIRLVLARYLALALEFQLGADILSTAVSPSWEQIGKLGAIAVIRTGLNYFLMKEMELEKAQSSDAPEPHPAPQP